MFTLRSRARGRRGDRGPRLIGPALNRLEDRIAPAQLVVTSSLDNSSAGTLRSILATANKNGEADTITFASAVTSITLAAGQLTISESKNLSIDGGGKVTLNGAAKYGIFSLTAVGSPTISIANITLEKGNVSSYGGAVYLTTQQLLMTNVSLLNNSSNSLGGAIYLYGSGSVVLNSCSLTGNVARFGGAIYLYGYGTGSVSLQSCQLLGNTANNYGFGGAIYAEGGKVVIDSCTIQNNEADYCGGGIELGTNSSATITNTTVSSNKAGNAGGIDIYNASATIVNCTVAENTAEYGTGGIYFSAGGLPQQSLVIRNSTIAMNSVGDTYSAYAGGLAISIFSSYPAIQIDSSIIAANSVVSDYGTSNLDVSLPSGLQSPIAKGSNNLFGAATGTINGTNNFIGTSNNPFDAGLLPLGNYGGLTQTMPLRYNSFSLNRGSNPSGLLFDQRGQPRATPMGSPDIGAFEGTASLPFVAKFGPLANVSGASNAPYLIEVTYDGPTGTDTSSLDGMDIVVSGPVPLPPIQLLSHQVSGNQVTATYQLNPPGGVWDPTDIGVYSVALNKNQVLGNAPAALSVVGQPLGSFQVGVAGTITVDSTADAVDGNYGPGQVTLREAIGLANQYSGTDTITFDPLVFNTSKSIVLNSELPIRNAVVINGPGADLLAISGNMTNRIFNISSSYTGVTMSGLKLVEGKTTGNGGAILLGGQNLVLKDCVVANNAATGDGGAISLAGASASTTLTVDRCLFSNNRATNGGAVDGNTHLVTINESTLSNNTAISTGGAFSGGYVALIRSTVNNNSAINGAGLAISPGKLSTIDNSTISGNTASEYGGGISHVNNAEVGLVLRNATIFGNFAGLSGGGLWVATNLSNTQSSSTIIAGNQSSGGPDLAANVPTVILGSNNLIGIADVGQVSLTGAGNLTGTSISPLNAKLGPLANNGGPTLTHFPGGGSPIIDKGNNSTVGTTDQRGMKRVTGSASDIGAVEGVSVVPTAAMAQLVEVNASQTGPCFFAVTYSDDTSQINVLTINTGDLTITGPNLVAYVPSLFQVNVGTANVTAIYRFDPPLNSAAGWDSSDNGSYTISINSNEVFDLDLPAPQSCSGGTLGLITVQAADNVLVVNATNDEAVDTDGKLSLREALAKANSNKNTLDRIEFDPVVFASPQVISVAKSGLGGLAIQGPTALVGTGSTKLALVGDQQHTVIYASGVGAVTISDLTVTGGQNGIGVDSFWMPVTLERMNIVGNGHLLSIGGGLYVSSSAQATLRDSTIANNVGYFGAGAYVNGGKLSVGNCSFFGNTSRFDGGALYVGGYYSSGNSVQLVNSTVTSNSATRQGGGVCFQIANDHNDFRVEGCVIADNDAAIGPDAISDYGGLTARNSFFGVIDASFVFTDRGGNTLGSTTQPADAKLGAIGMDGGPTPVVGLLPGSPLLNKADNSDFLAFDQRGFGFPRSVGTGTDIGAYEGISVLPSARITPVPVITTPGVTPNKVTVTYRDGTGIKAASIDVGDITIRGPGNIPAPIIQATAKQVGDKIFAEYTFIPPGGSWEGSDAGDYIIRVVGGEVFDTDASPHSIAPVQLGRFQVSLDSVFVVDEPTDIDDGDFSLGHLSFREALSRANFDPLTNDTIVFDPSVFPTGTTIVNESVTSFSWFNINSPVNIIGPGPDRLTLDANKLARAINVSVHAIDKFVAISGLTIMNGNATDNYGGGVLVNSGLVTLDNVVITQCKTSLSGGGIGIGYGSNAVTIRNSRITNNSAQSSYGGGIYVAGGWEYSKSTLIVEQSNISGNSAHAGGGIFAGEYSVLQVTNSTIVGNQASGSFGGGIGLNEQIGAGSFVRNSTISGNSATTGGGIGLRQPQGTLEISNCTLTNNKANSGGGFSWSSNTYNYGGTLLFLSSIVAGNTASNGPDGSGATGFSVAGANNLIGVSGDSSFTFSAAHNLLGTKTTPLDAKLGPLADNGGPTLTHALLPGSPAINAGSNTANLSNDQRGTGFARVVGGQADIGAYEEQTPPPRVLSIKVNDGAQQRSIVTSFQVTFSENVSFPSGIASGFSIQQIGSGGSVGTVNFNAVPSGSVATITFANGGAIGLDPGGSLPDGKYLLTILANKVLGVGGQLDGDSNGTAGDNFTFTTHRLFGDADGNGAVTASDFSVFRIAYGSAGSIFDFNNDGQTGTADYAQFRLRYGVVI